MERYIGMDVHAASCTLAVISEKGRKLKDFPVETNGQALVEAVRMIPGHKHLVFEEGLQSAWLYETLSPHVDEIVVAGISESRGQKSDKGDAYSLAEDLRVGNFGKRVFKAPRQFTSLRELSRIHMTLVGDVVRGQSRIKSLYRGDAVASAWQASLARDPEASWCQAKTCTVFVTGRSGRRSFPPVHKRERFASTIISTSCWSKKSKQRPTFFARPKSIGLSGFWSPPPASDRFEPHGWFQSS